MSEEQWRPVVGFDMYEVSDHGRVRNVKTKKALRPSSDRGGYQIVCLRREGKQYCRGVHRLVAQQFLGNVIGFDVKHEDLNKTNNVSTNLKIMTRKENIEHSVRNGAQYEHVSTSGLICNETGEYFPSIGDAAKFLKTRTSILSRHLDGRTSNVKGFTFTIVDEEPKVIRRKRTNTRVGVIHVQTGDVYESVAYASTVLDIPIVDIMLHLKGRLDLQEGFDFMWLD